MHSQITALWGGKEVELRETPRAVTPFGGLVVFFEFLRQVGYFEAVAASCRFVSLPPTRSIRSRPHGALAVGGGGGAAFRTTLAACRYGLARTAGDSRFPVDDTLRNLSSGSGRDRASDFSRVCGPGSWHGFRNVLLFNLLGEFQRASGFPVIAGPPRYAPRFSCAALCSGAPANAWSCIWSLLGVACSNAYLAGKRLTLHATQLRRSSIREPAT